MKYVPLPPADLPPVLAGLVCPYCGGNTEYVNGSSVWKDDTRMIYLCRPCKAWVGVHKGTDQALGRVANADLRALKKLAHRWFDPIAVEGLINDFYTTTITGMGTREKAYYWLAGQMNIKKEYCHIGMFGEDECKRVIAICQPIVESFEGSGDIW